METSQKSIRVMHHLSEFLDLDAQSFTNIAEFIALIQAIREGLSRIDPTFSVSDFHINLLFLSKLQAHPKWNDWARSMLRDQRVNVSDSEKTMSFSELAELAIRHERETKGKTKTRQTENNTGRLQNYTQEEINSFVIRQMRHTHTHHNNNNNNRQDQGSVTNFKRHSKRPSQEEINEFVVRQMREEQERKTRARSKSEPKPSNQAPMAAEIEAYRTTKSADNDDQYAKCDTCGKITHRGRTCHHNMAEKDAKPPVVQVPRGNFLPKKVEFMKRTADGLPMYRTGFALT